MVTFNHSRIVLKEGDITREVCDAIVNAANSSLMGGGGVDGAIHGIGGEQVHEDCLKIVAQQGGCPTGQAVVTRGGNLPIRFLIHAVGPVWRGGGYGEDELLRSTYLNGLRIASAMGAKTIAFPSISTGAYRFPIHRAAAIALQAIFDYVHEHNHFSEVRLVLFCEEDLRVYEGALAELVASQS